MGFLFSQRISLEFEFVGLVYQPVEDSISHGGIADQFVPSVEGVLAGEERGAHAVIEDLEEEAVLVWRQGYQAPIINDEEIDAGEFLQEPGKTTIRLRQGEFAEQLGQVVVADAEALSAGFVRQGTG